MTDEEIAREICKRALVLFRRKAKPLRILDHKDDGSREFTFGNWWFRLEFYVPRHWVLGGPPFGSLKRLGVYVAGQYTDPPFWIDVETKPDGPGGADRPPWAINREACLGSLIPSLKQLMILDDLAEIR